ncbi:hypothetical protein AB0J83_46805 [Actinoplanes sp. NPDC049596]|uniref:hypothetical protein n=1 Tax=unclassified Actinoplanes TaxID=2626549 RepID=UPI00342C5C11
MSRKSTGAALVGLLALTGVLLVAPTANAAEPTTDLVVEADDLNTRGTRVGPRDVRPLYAGVHNRGETTVSDFSITVTVPYGATFVERYRDCTYVNWYPNAREQGGFVYGPTEVTCLVPLDLGPDTELALYDPVSDKSLFNVRFGRNLAGPEEHAGFFSVASAPDPTGTPGDGPSFKEALTTVPPRPHDEIDGSNSAAQFSVWSAPNGGDVAVTVPPVRGKAGDTVDLAFEVYNNGPSDGSGPTVLITAPSGTAILPAESCWTEGTDHEQQPESARVRCVYEGFFPTVNSGQGIARHSVPLKIKSSPGTDGVVEASGVRTETKPGNNKAPIVVQP